MHSAFLHHWPEYLIEGALLGLFMLSACLVVVVVAHPDSPVARRVTCPIRRRVLIGAAMGLTAVALIYSSWGQRSGAHMNPAVTLAFASLGKVAPTDAAFYILAQVIGGTAGVVLARVILGARVAHPSVNYVVTLPGPKGPGAAFAGEVFISFILFGAVLVLSNHAPTAPYTGFAAGTLVALYITLEAPISGMSLNPARTLASALVARRFDHLWVYLLAPPLAMLAAGAIYSGTLGRQSVNCAKLDHPVTGDCHFKCRFAELQRHAHAHPANPQPTSSAGIPK